MKELEKKLEGLIKMDSDLASAITEEAIMEEVIEILSQKIDATEAGSDDEALQEEGTNLIGE